MNKKIQCIPNTAEQRERMIQYVLEKMEEEEKEIEEEREEFDE